MLQDDTLMIPVRVKDLHELIKTIEETTRILTLREDAEAYTKRGIAKNKYWFFEEGAQDLAKAMQLNPIYASGQVNLSIVEQYLKTIENGQKFVQMWQSMCDAFKT